MIRTTPLKVLAAGSAIALAGGVAVASAMPDAATEGLGTASEKAGFEVPASENANAAQLEESEATEETDEVEALDEGDETEELEGDELETQQGGPEGNHGAVVSEFAQSTELEGAERGQAVAEVAQSDEGKPEQAGGPEETDAELEETEESDVDTDEGEADHE